ncbi:hypothetical protein KW800_03205 [Candidatus Parcubacteria bacterium]|nr:hypothetical protein [Candidatus Parcubacteria bacterium]
MWVLACGFLAIVFGAAGYYVTHQTTQTSTLETPSATATSTLVTYTNTRLGFSIGIPQNASTSDRGDIVSIKPEALPYSTASNVWNIRVLANINSNADLDKFVKSAYNPACKFTGLSTTTVPHLYDVNFEDMNPNAEPGVGCFVNYITVIKYDDSQHKLAQWNIGQDSIFDGVDIKMADSFMFISTSTAGTAQQVTTGTSTRP